MERWTSWQELTDVHVGGTLRLSQTCFPHLEHSPYGAVVNVSSIAASRGFPDRASYNSSKAAIEALTRTLAFEWAPRGIRVNAIAPGYILTSQAQEMHDEGRIDLATRAEDVPMGRLGLPEEVASVVAFLLSQDASYVSGQVLAVDGGYLAHPGSGARGA